MGIEIFGMEGTTGRGTYLSSGHLGTYEGKVLEGVEDGGGLRKSCGEEGDSVDVGKRNSAPESGLKIDLNLRQSFPTVGTRSKAAVQKVEGWWNVGPALPLSFCISPHFSSVPRTVSAMTRARGI
jgi:hypothetical protein